MYGKKRGGSRETIGRAADPAKAGHSAEDREEPEKDAIFNYLDKHVSQKPNSDQQAKPKGRTERAQRGQTQGVV